MTACRRATDRVWQRRGTWASDSWDCTHTKSVVVAAPFTGKRIDPGKFCAQVRAKHRRNNRQIICVLKEIFPHTAVPVMQRYTFLFILLLCCTQLHSGFVDAVVLFVRAAQFTAESMQITCFVCAPVRRCQIENDNFCIRLNPLSLHW